MAYIVNVPVCIVTCRMITVLYCTVLYKLDPSISVIWNYVVGKHIQKILAQARDFAKEGDKNNNMFYV